MVAYVWAIFEHILSFCKPMLTKLTVIYILSAFIVKWRFVKAQSPPDSFSPFSSRLGSEETIFNNVAVIQSGVLNEITDFDVLFLRVGRGNGRTETTSPKNDHFEGRNDLNITEFFLRLRETGYDTLVRPNILKKPVVVSVSMFINSISAISESNMDFTMDFYFRQTWTDNRLAWIEKEHEKDQDTIEDAITLSGDYFAALWRPDTFFVNEKSSSFHFVTGLNSFIRIMPDGHVTQSYRLTVRAICHMTFKFFPLDHQKCPLYIESYSLPASDMIFRWHRTKDEEINTEAAGFSSDASSLLHYVIHGYRTIEVFNVREDGFNHSRLLFNVYLARDLGYYLIQVYIPASLIVIISWISFWIPRNVPPARVPLGVTTVLTMVTFTSHGFKAGLPSISYLKAMDIYLLSSFIMVFAALLEYAIVSYVDKSIKSCEAYRLTHPIGTTSQRNQDDTDDDQIDTGLSDPDDEDEYCPTHHIPSAAKTTDQEELSAVKCECYLPHSTPSSIEWMCRFGFPSVFTLFNIIYWNYFLNNQLSNIESDYGFVDFNLD